MCRALGQASAAAVPKALAFERDFYLENPTVAARTEEEVDHFRKQNDIYVDGSGIPRPITSFEETSFPGQSRPVLSILMSDNLSDLARNAIACELSAPPVDCVPVEALAGTA